MSASVSSGKFRAPRNVPRTDVEPSDEEVKGGVDDRVPDSSVASKRPQCSSNERALGQTSSKSKTSASVSMPKHAASGW